MTRLKLVDIDTKNVVEIDVDGQAHPTKIIDKLKELGILKPNETAMFGVSPDERHIYYVPAATVDQLIAYLNQTKQILYYRRYPIHGYRGPTTTQQERPTA